MKLSSGLLPLVKLSSGLLPCLLHQWSCIAPLFLDTIWVSSYQERLYSYSAQNCQQETAGNEPAIGVVLHHWRLFFSIRFEFQVIRKGCEGSGDDSWSDAESLCDSDGNSNVKCGKVVSGKRCVAWNVTRDVGWTLGELSRWGWSVKLAEVSVSVDLFLQCPSQVAAESSLSLARRLARIGGYIASYNVWKFLCHVIRVWNPKCWK